MLSAYHNRLKSQGYAYVIGIDEAGRGPMAGPVVAAAVILKTDQFSSPIRDSKKLTAIQREKAFMEITENSIYGVGMINETVIDIVNIYEATLLAMHNAVAQVVLQLPKEEINREDFKDRVYLLIDGNHFKTDMPFPYETVIKGDDKELSIACASIIAKVTRDRILAMYDKIYPQYGFGKHKGYLTALHRKAIETHGFSSIHRRSFQFNEI